MNETWIRLYNSRYPIPGGTPGFSWAMWRKNYAATPWPHDELKPDFAYYICETMADGTRAISHRAKVTRVLPPTEVATPEEAYDLVAEHVFDDDLRIAPNVWHDYHYNALKAETPWPKRVVAWRAETEPIGPHTLPGLCHFPHTAWTKSDAISL